MKIPPRPSRILIRPWQLLPALLLTVAVAPAAMAAPILPLAGAVQMVFSQCACLCVEGVPKTLCTTVDEAQAEPGLCGQRHCPEYVATETVAGGGQRYVSPHAFADNCRDVRVWDPGIDRYTGIKVCDVLELGAAGSGGFAPETTN